MGTKITIIFPYILGALFCESTFPNYHQRILKTTLKIVSGETDKTVAEIASSKTENVYVFYKSSCSFSSLMHYLVIRLALLTLVKTFGEFNLQLLTVRLLVKLFKYIDNSESDQKKDDPSGISDLQSNIMKLASSVNFLDTNIYNVRIVFIISFNIQHVSHQSARELLNDLNMKYKVNDERRVFSLPGKSLTFANIPFYTPMVLLFSNI